MPHAEPIRLDVGALRHLPLPDHGPASSKNDRGRVLVIGGSRETPGGVELAGLAVLRAGAGRVRLATVDSVAVPLAVRFPEARVTGLPETADGHIDPDRSHALDDAIAEADVVLIGSGMLDPGRTGALAARVVSRCDRGTIVVFDAAAIQALGEHPELVAPLDGRAIVIPNPSEMAALLGWEEDRVRDDPAPALDAAIERLGAPTALRDATTWIGDPAGRRFVDGGGGDGLGTPGSGDVLAGLLAGLLGRGADPTTALVWAVHTHAVAGRRVNGGTLGLLARDLVDAIPIVLATMEGRASPRPD